VKAFNDVDWTGYYVEVVAIIDDVLWLSFRDYDGSAELNDVAWAIVIDWSCGNTIYGAIRDAARFVVSFGVDP